MHCKSPFLVALLMLAFTLGQHGFNYVNAQSGTIKNDVFWHTKDGLDVLSIARVAAYSGLPTRPPEK